jgi:hypothetical protein
MKQTPNKKSRDEVKKVARREAKLLEDAAGKAARAKGKRNSAKTELERVVRDYGGSQPYAAGSVRRMARNFSPSVIEKRAYQYLLGLLNPSIPNMPGNPYGLPPQLQTQRWHAHFSGTFAASSGGFAAFLIGADSWQLETLNSGIFYGPKSGERVLGSTTNGWLLAGTDGSGAQTTFGVVTLVPPAAGYFSVVPGGAGSNSSAVMPGSNAVSLNMLYRMVSAEIRCQPVSSEQVQSGTLLGVRKIDQNDASTAHVLVAQTYAQLANLEPDVAELQEITISKWPEGHWMRIPLIPSTETASEFFILNGVGRSQSGNPSAGFFASGAVQFQSFRYECDVNWETTVIPSYLASGQAPALPVQVASSDVPSTALLSRTTPLVRMEKEIGQINGVTQFETKVDAAAQAMADHKALTEPSGATTGWLDSIIGGVAKAAPYIESGLALAASFL